MKIVYFSVISFAFLGLCGEFSVHGQGDVVADRESAKATRAVNLCKLF